MTEFSLSLQQSVSPFDSLRRIDEQGKEYWSARDLMPLLGYSKWENFKNVIEVAKENVETVVDNVTDHFPSSGNMVKRPQGGGIYNLLGDVNPRLAQFLIDHAISDLMESTHNSLTGEKLKGVVGIAEDMGLPVTIKNRSTLGKFVKSSCGHLAIQEQRLVNGRIQSVACYPE